MQNHGILAKNTTLDKNHRFHDFLLSLVHAWYFEP